MKLYVAPKFDENALGGVAAVIADHKIGLKKYGVTFTFDEEKADLVIAHALTQTKRTPDVFHCHGFYPTAKPGWGTQFTEANKVLFESLMSARKIISVSNFAAETMRRDFHIQPSVIRNGIYFTGLKPGGYINGYTLWPKLDVSPTCNPEPVIWLAKNRKDLRLASLVQLSNGIKFFGRLPHNNFVQLLQECSIYLGTTLENNSMGMMEAMAIGIPIVGFDWGFSKEWLKSGIGCELVEPGNMEGLSAAISKVRSNWRLYHSQARRFARDTFTWDEPIRQIYEVYNSLLSPKSPSKVSVVIPLYNYSRWVGKAIQSAQEQTTKPIEIIVVDDASTDNPIIPDGVKVIKLKQNSGVAVARNTGIAAAKGDIILCLDADDMLISMAIETLLPLFKKPIVGVAFSGLKLMNEKGHALQPTWFTSPFDYGFQRTGHNTVPTCAMFRKSAWARVGGFRSYEKPCEDAGFWLRISSQGWEIEHIEEEFMLNYRTHGIVSSVRSGSETQLNPAFDWWKKNKAWSARNSSISGKTQIYDCPKVCFTIIYLEKEEKQFIQTIDSIEGLIEIEWEICAEGYPSPLILSGWPFIRWNTVPSCTTIIDLVAGEVLDDDKWDEIIAFMEFPSWT